MGLELVGDCAIVTGGAQGIGRGIAALLLDHGADVLLLDVNADAVAATAAELTAGAVATSGRRALAHAGSVTDAADVEAAFAAAEVAFGTPRILVNNAGIARAARIAETGEEQWAQTFDVHVKGTFLCTRAFARRAETAGFASGGGDGGAAGTGPAGGGAIVNLSSVNAVTPSQGTADYSAAKAGIAQFTKVAALELAPYGVTVNAIAPGGTLTPLAEANAAMRAAFVARTPLGRFGHVEDVARVAVFLASDYGAWLTGATLPVDGGLHMRGLHDFHAVLSGASDGLAA